MIWTCFLKMFNARRQYEPKREREKKEGSATFICKWHDWRTYSLQIFFDKSVHLNESLKMYIPFNVNTVNQTVAIWVLTDNEWKKNYESSENCCNFYFFYSLLNGGFAPNKTFNSRFGFEHRNISLQIYCDVKTNKHSYVNNSNSTRSMKLTNCIGNFSDPSVCIEFYWEYGWAYPKESVWDVNMIIRKRLR